MASHQRKRWSLFKSGLARHAAYRLSKTQVPWQAGHTSDQRIGWSSLGRGAQAGYVPEKDLLPSYRFWSCKWQERAPRPARIRLA
jgi:hypothetical protein